MTVPRRNVLRGAGVALLAAALPIRAQRSGALPRIGYLTPGNNPRDPAFWKGMRELGYVEGRTMVVERRSADGDFARLPALAAEIVATRPDVIVTAGSAPAIAARQATSTIPIVFAGAADPIAAGLMANLAHPAGNVTGTSTQSTAAIGKLLELVRQVRPKAARVGVLWDPVNAISQQLRLGETLIAAARLQLLTRVVEVNSREELDRAFAALGATRPDAILVSSDTFVLTHASRVVELALAQRVPVFSTNRQLAEAGIFASYGANVDTVARHAATYVQRILTGARPGDLPVELPTRFELVINMRTADAIGLAVPAAVVARADEVIR